MAYGEGARDGLGVNVQHLANLKTNVQYLAQSWYKCATFSVFCAQEWDQLDARGCGNSQGKYQETKPENYPLDYRLIVAVHFTSAKLMTVTRQCITNKRFE